MNLHNIILNISQRLYFHVFSFALIFIPLVFVADTRELFEFPKAFLLYFIAVVLIFIFALDVLLNEKKIKTPSLPVLFFLTTFILSTVFSMHMYTSVWGYFTRFSDSLMSLCALFIIYWVGKSVLTHKDLFQLAQIVFLPFIPISILGISQHFGFFSGEYWFGEKVTRVYSTFGQPNWLAQYIVMLLPLIVFKLVQSKKTYYWYFLFSIGYLCLLFTYSMSGFIGFGLSFIFSVMVIIKNNGLRETKYKLFLLSSFVVICPFIFPGIFALRLRDIKQDLIGYIIPQVFAQNIPQDPSKYSVSDAGYIRKYAWLGTWGLITSSPKVLFIGTGPETYPYAFQKHRPVELNYSSEWSYLFNKPHNYYLETWSENGLIGLFSYILLLAYLIKNVSWDKKAGLLGFMATNIFGWPVVATALIFWFWLLEMELTHE